MNWDAIGAIGEIVGALAVFVTLVYLAIQVNHAKEQVRRSVQQVRHSTFRELFLTAAQSPQITSVLGKAESVWSELETEEQLFEAAKFSLEDQLVWRHYHRALWSHIREVIENRNELTPSQSKELDRAVIILFGQSPSRLYFKSMESINSPTVIFVK